MKHRILMAAMATMTAAVTLAYAPAAIASSAPAAAQAPAVSAPAAKQQFGTLADDYYTALARYEPVNATQNGDNRFDDQIGMSISPAVRAKQFALYHGYQKRLKAIARTQLNRSDRIHYDVLAFELKTLLSFEKFPEYLLPLNQMDSMPVTLANYAGGEASQPLTTVKEYCLLYTSPSPRDS